jgi:S1-C subfamily serine protease
LNEESSVLKQSILIAISAVALVGFVLQSQATPQDEQDEAETMGRRLLNEISTPENAMPHCMLGASAVWIPTNTVLRVQSGVTQLMPGDRILTINGLDISGKDFRQVLHAFGATDTVAVGIDRGGTSIAVDIPCQDSSAINKMLRAVYRLMAARDFQGCVGLTQSQLIHENGNTAAFQRLSNQCSRAIGQLTDSALYEQMRMEIEEAAYAGPDALGEMRSRLLVNLVWFERDGSDAYAQDLRQLFDVALKNANARRTISASASATRSVIYGTCFLVSPDGIVLTSNHVVEGARQIRVSFGGKALQEASLIAATAATDIAVLRTERKTRNYLSLAPLRSVRVGEQVFTYGYPATDILGSEPKFTDGTISALSGPGGEATLLQMSVPIQPGNSGGPVVNTAGQVVGIVAATAALEPFLKSVGTLPQNVNWAVKADYSRMLFDAPPIQGAAPNRQAAIDRTRAALCQVEARSQ